MSRQLRLLLLGVGVASAAALGCSPVDCVEPGGRVEAVYSGAEGTQREDVVVGVDLGQTETHDGACTGRCGAGCSANAEDLHSGAWLAACVAHDVCAFRHQSWGFVLDAHCGDEAWAAFSDYLRFQAAGCRAGS